MAKQLPIDGPVIALEEGKRYSVVFKDGDSGTAEFIGVNLGMYLVGWWLLRFYDGDITGEVCAYNPANVTGIVPV